MSKRKVWISRERKGHDLAYLIWISEVKPIWNGIEWDNAVDATFRMESLKAKGFKKLFGFTPRKGSCELCELGLRRIAK